VDGVAINGVSGGPAFFIHEKDENSKICGVITAYIPNRATREVLPGLCVVKSVKPFHGFLKRIKSWEEAQQKAKKQQEKALKTTFDKKELRDKEDKIGEESKTIIE